MAAQEVAQSVPEPFFKTECMGDLYFIRAGEWIKIGRSANVPARLAHYRTHSPIEPELVAIFQGQGWNEPVWHYAFGADRVRGEWFRITDELMDAIAAIGRKEEWIATLRPSAWQLRDAEEAFEANPIEMEAVFKTPLNYAEHRRRNKVADYEELISERTGGCVGYNWDANPEGSST